MTLIVILGSQWRIRQAGRRDGRPCPSGQWKYVGLFC
nr:MAG TPA: hypothetical protein [Bacteriophage sp.]